MNTDYSVYFRLWPLRYFLAREKDLKYWCIVKKQFDPKHGYYWKEL